LGESITYIIIERDVMVSMPDGVKLATDIYWPDDGANCPPSRIEQLRSA